MTGRGEEPEIRVLTEADLPAVARVHLAAFPASALTALGEEAVRRYYAWQLASAPVLAPLGAFVGDRLAGFCFAGVFREALRGFLRTSAAYLAWRVATRPWLLGNELLRRQLAPALRALRPGRRKAVAPPPGAEATPRFDVLAIAVHPGHARGGVGARLMAATEEAARAEGFALMGLTVHASNEPAVAFYRRLGYDWDRSPDAFTGQMLKRLD